MTKYYQVLISAETIKHANKILDALLKERLVLGGPVIKGPARFWWKNKIVKMDYCYIITYTSKSLINRVSAVVDKSTEEEAPMISFIPMEANKQLVKLLKDTLTQ